MKIPPGNPIRNIPNSTYGKFLFFLITRFSKYICNQVPVKVIVTLIYLYCSSENCISWEISNMAEWRSTFHSATLPFLFTLPIKADIHSLVGFPPFPHQWPASLPAALKEFIFPEALTLVRFQIHCHCQTDLSLLFSSQHSLFFLPLLHYLIPYFSSFYQISLRQHRYLILQHQKGFVLFLQLPTERSITACPNIIAI